MAKYGKKAEETIESAMHRRKKGTLKSSSGQKVKSRKQAIAIGLSKARRAGVKLPPPKKGRASEETREQAKKDIAKGRSGAKPSAKRSRASLARLKKEGRSAASHTALSRQARSAARSRRKAA